MGNSATVRVCYGITLPEDCEMDLGELEDAVESFEGIKIVVYDSWDYPNYIIAIGDTFREEDWGVIQITFDDHPTDEYSHRLLAAYEAVKDKFEVEYAEFRTFEPKPTWVAASFWG